MSQVSRTLATVRAELAARNAFRASLTRGATVAIKGHTAAYRVRSVTADSVRVVRLRDVPVKRGAGSAWADDEVGGDLTFPRTQVLPPA